MGWWWSSSDQTSNVESPTTSLPTQTTSRILDDTPPNTTPSTPSPSTTTSEKTREEIAGDEFAQFLTEFEAAQKAENTTQRSSSDLDSRIRNRMNSLVSTFKPSSSSPHNTSRDIDTSQTKLYTPSTDPSDISFEAIAEEQISCRTAFDYAFYCQSMGGQFNNVYRYGELRQCSHLWSEFWLCMRAKSYPDERRRKVFKQHNIEKLKGWRQGPNSEDIWDVREKLDLDAPEPFKGDLVKLEKEMKEWQEKTGKGAGIKI